MIISKRSKTLTAQAFFVQTALHTYTYLQSGTLNTKAQILAEIATTFNKNIFNIKNKEQLTKRILYLLQNLSSNKFKNRINRIKIENSAIFNQINEDTVKLFTDNKENKLLERFKYINTNAKDLINNCYLVLSSQTQVFYYDTTEQKENGESIYITSLKKGSSRYNKEPLITEKTPRGEQIAEWLETIFRGNKNVIILHSDTAGANVSQVVLNKLKELNITPSFTQTIRKNQVSERSHRTLWNQIKRIIVPGLEEQSIFFFSKEIQRAIIMKATDLINNKKSNSTALPKGTTPAEQEIAVRLTNYGNILLLGKPNTETGYIIQKANKAAHKRYIIIIKQIEFSKQIKQNFQIQDPAQTDVSKEVGALNLNNLNKYEEVLDTQLNTLNKLTKNNISTTEEALIFVEKLIKEEKGIHTDKNQRVIMILQGISINLQVKSEALLNEMNKKQEESKAIILRQTDEINEMKKLLEKNLNLQNIELVEKQKLRIQAEIRKIRKRKQSKQRFAIFPEDFTVILETINSKDLFTKARDRIAHVILKIFGIRVSNLKYMNLRQLDNLFSKRDVYLKPIKSIKKEEIVFPYVKEYEKFTKHVKKDFDFIKENIKIYEEKNNTKYKRHNRPKIEGESELWGTNKLLREVLNKRINQQLIKPSILLDKKLTSHSYRRGLAIIIARTQGILAAKEVLNHTNIGSTQAYMEKRADKKTLINIFKKAHAIENSNKIDLTQNFDEQVNEILDIETTQI